RVPLMVRLRVDDVAASLVLPDLGRDVLALLDAHDGDVARLPRGHVAEGLYARRRRLGRRSEFDQEGRRIDLRRRALAGRPLRLCRSDDDQDGEQEHADRCGPELPERPPPPIAAKSEWCPNVSKRQSAMRPIQATVAAY